MIHAAPNSLYLVSCSHVRDARDAALLIMREKLVVLAGIGLLQTSDTLRATQCWRLAPASGGGLAQILLGVFFLVLCTI
jgi:hypothetical protein